MTTEYVMTPYKFTLHRKGTSPFCELSTAVSIEDEGGGPFLVLSCQGQEIRLDPEELATLAQMLPAIFADFEDHSKPAF